MIVNPGIRRTIAWLNSYGFKTCDSGDGETHDFECDRPDPYVVIEVDPEVICSKTVRLHVLLRDSGIDLGPVGSLRSDVEALAELVTEPLVPHDVTIEATYDPIDGRAFINVSGLHDGLLPALPAEPSNKTDPGCCGRCEQDVPDRKVWWHALGASRLCADCYAGETRLQGDNALMWRAGAPDFP